MRPMEVTVSVIQRFYLEFFPELCFIICPVQMRRAPFLYPLCSGVWCWLICIDVFQDFKPLMCRWMSPFLAMSFFGFIARTVFVDFSVNLSKPIYKKSGCLRSLRFVCFFYNSSKIIFKRCVTSCIMSCCSNATWSRSSQPCCGGSECPRSCRSEARRGTRITRNGTSMNCSRCVMCHVTATQSEVECFNGLFLCFCGGPGGVVVGARDVPRIIMSIALVTPSASR